MTASPDPTALPRQPRPRPRPLIDDLDVRLAAVELAWPGVAAWLRSEGDLDVDEEAAAAKLEIAAALEHGDTGYAVCRTLDRKGWSPDDDLVDVMGGVVSRRHDALRRAEEAWVAANDVRPVHVVGDRVSIARYPGRFDRTRVDGEVISVHPERGRYLVFCEVLGHVRDNRRVGSRGRYVNYEDAFPPGVTSDAEASG